MTSMQISMFFMKVERSYITPPGLRLATYEEVRDNLESIKDQHLLTGKERARLLDGWISGPDYNFEMGNNFRFCIGYMLLTQSHPQDNYSSGDSGKELYEGVALTEEGKQVALLLCCEDWNYEVVYWLLNSWDKTETMDARDVITLNNAPAFEEMKKLNNLINDLARKLGEASISVKVGNENLTLRSIKDVLSDLWGTSCWDKLTESNKTLLGRSFQIHLAVAYRSVGKYWIQAFESHTDSVDALWNVMWDHFSTEVLRICTTLSFQVMVQLWNKESSQVTRSEWNFILSTSILHYMHKSISSYSLLFKEKHGKHKMLEKLMMVPCDGNFNVLDNVLHLAAGDGNVVIIEKMLDCGADALSQNEEKQTALHVAFAHIKEEDKIYKVLKVLLARCDAKEQLVNTRDGAGKTVLHLASSQGKGKMCSLLLDNKAEADAKDNCDRLPLHYAVEEKSDEVIDVLIGRNASDQQTIHMIQSCKDRNGKTPLDIGVDQKNIKLLTKILPLLDEPPEIYFDSVDIKAKLLRQLALEGKTDFVRKLLEKGVSPVDVDEEGKTALHYAAMCEDDFARTDTIDLLLKCQDRKKLISICDSKGKTALHVLAYRGHPSFEDKVFADLLDIVDVTDKEGRNCLYDATEGKSDIFDTIHVILSMMEKKGIALDDMIDHKGLTPLHVAASQGKVFQSDVLLRRSANPKKYVKVSDYKGQTALHKAGEGGHVDTIKVLLHWGAQPLLERDWQGRTALHYVVQRKTGEKGIAMVELLLKKCGSRGKQLLFLGISAEGLGIAQNVLSDCPLKSFLEDKIKELTNPDINMLRTAASLGHTEMAKQLLREGAKRKDLKDFEWLRLLEPEELNNVVKVLSEIDRSPMQPNDQPSVDDCLGRADFAYGLAALLLNPYVEPPIAIGICGSWGMGKSSLMAQTEIILLKTAAQSALSPTFKSSEIQAVKDLVLSERGKKKYEEIKRWVEALVFRENVIKYFLKWMITIPLRLKNGILCRKRKNPLLSEDEDILVRLLKSYRPEYCSIFKSLAAMDRSCNFTREDQEYFYEEIKTVPAIITVQYNAWKYRNESEALAGLAVEITKEMEGLMTEAQWLSTCCRNTWRSQKQTILINVIFPCVLTIFLAGTFALILWLLLDSFNLKQVVKLKYASLPATIVIMVWSVGKSVMATLNPVSTQLMNYIKFPDHTDKLGYQERVISDITFLKREIRRKPFFLCTAASCIWHVITSCCFILYLWPKFFRETMLNRQPASISTSDHEKDDPRIIVFTKFFGKTVFSRQPASTSTSDDKKDDPRIIVFVDDLDRCKESVILQVLSAINLVLAVCKISVIVGMDKAMIYQAIIKRHGDKSQLHSEPELAEKYLQKIIQLSLDLPDPSQDEFRRFLEVQIGVLTEQVKEPDDESYSEIDSDYDALFSPFERRNEITDIGYNVKEILIPENLLPDPPVTTQMETEASVDTRINVHTANAADPQVTTQMETEESDTGIDDDPIANAAGGKGLEERIPITEMLFVRYNSREQEAFCYFQKMVTGHRKLPRQWKCLLYYHRWVWCICFMKSLFVGWDVELIAWIFTCWEWQDNMDLLIQEWNKIGILKAYKSESGSSEPTLREIVEYYIENNIEHKNMVGYYREEVESKELKPEKPKEDSLKEKEVSNNNTEEMKAEKMSEDLKGKSVSETREDPRSSNREQKLKEITQQAGEKKKIDKYMEEKELNDWRRMRAALNNYDVSMKSIKAFQKFRFFCKAGNLEWPLPKQETLKT